MKETVNMDSAYGPSEEVVAREIEGELIIVPLTADIGDADGELYTLNETGRAIWDALDGINSLKSIADKLSETYDAPNESIVADLTGLVKELLERRMVVESVRK